MKKGIVHVIITILICVMASFSQASNLELGKEKALELVKASKLPDGLIRDTYAEKSIYKEDPLFQIIQRQIKEGYVEKTDEKFRDYICEYQVYKIGSQVEIPIYFLNWNITNKVWECAIRFFGIKIQISDNILVNSAQGVAEMVVTFKLIPTPQGIQLKKEIPTSVIFKGRPYEPLDLETTKEFKYKYYLKKWDSGWVIERNEFLSR